MSRRAKKTGSVYKENHRWVAQVYYNGKKIRKFFPTKFEAQSHLLNLTKPSGQTLTQWLGVWVKTLRVRSSTLSRYACTLKHVNWDCPLEGVTRQLFEEKTASLSQWEQKKVFRLLKQSLQYAVELGVLASSPLKGHSPRVPDVEPRYWTEEQVKKFLEATVKSSYHSLFKLLLREPARLKKIEIRNLLKL